LESLGLPQLTDTTRPHKTAATAVAIFSPEKAFNSFVEEIDEIEKRVPNRRFFSSKSVSALEKRLFTHL
jgi:hypothetical protein